MKEIREEKKVIEEVITYESIDGQMFRDKEECLKWEKSYQATMYASMEKIPHKCVDGDESYLPNTSCDDNVWILIPRNLEDITVINAYLDCVDSYCESKLTHEDIGKTICINFGYDYDWYTIYKYPEFIEEITKRFEKIETEIKEKFMEEK